MTSLTKLQLLQKFVVFLSKSAGRDQSCRLIQYTSTFLVNTIQDKAITTKIQFVGSSMSATRKVLRFGKLVALYVTVVTNLKAYFSATKSEQFDKSRNLLYLVSSLISNFFSMLFFLSDHVLWFCNIGVINNPKLKGDADWWADFTWIWESLCDSICAATELYLLHQKLSFIKSQNQDDQKIESQKVHDRIRIVKRDLVKAVLNIPMAYGFVTGNISRQKIGVLGIITSSIGIYQLLA